jgi:hypothetical protein
MLRNSQFLRKKLKKLFFFEVWNIGVSKCNIADFLTNQNQEIKWLKGVKIDEFRADPFGIVGKNGKIFIFFEKYDRVKRKGKISVIELNERLEVISQKDILDQKTHLSYPYIFSHKDENYALVENHKERER